MASTTCPRCGFVQEGGSECARCGVVFTRAHAPGVPHPRPVPQAAPAEAPPQRDGAPVSERQVPRPVEQEQPRRSWFGRAYRILRWATLAALVVVLLLILRTSAPPEVASAKDASARVEAKLAQMESALARGIAQPLEMDEAELNGWLHANLALAPPGGAPVSGDPEVEKMRSNVRDVKVQLADDGVRAWVLFDLHGKDMTLTLEARLYAQDGSLRLEPVAGWLGSLPVPAAALKNGFARALSDPANAEKLRLPPHIADIRVEGGRLIVTPAVPAAGASRSYAPNARPAAPAEPGGESAAAGEPGGPAAAPEETPAPVQEE